MNRPRLGIADAASFVNAVLSTDDGAFLMPK
jgi:hypothetical protein